METIYNNPWEALGAGFGSGMGQGAMDELSARRKMAMAEEEARRRSARELTSLLTLYGKMPVGEAPFASEYLQSTPERLQDFESRISQEHSLASQPGPVGRAPETTGGRPEWGRQGMPTDISQYLRGAQAVGRTAAKPLSGAGRQPKAASSLVDVALRSFDASRYPPGAVTRVAPGPRPAALWPTFAEDVRARIRAEHGREPTAEEWKLARQRFDIPTASISEMGR